jgi:hypothetical protein
MFLCQDLSVRLPLSTGFEAAHRVIDGNLRVCDVARELGCPEFFGLRVLRLASGVHRGVEIEQWQYEVTSGGRLWYLVNTEKRTL